MALAKIKTAEERERLDRIFAEVEAAERGEPLEPAETRTQEQIAEDNRKAKIDRLANADITTSTLSRFARPSSWGLTNRRSQAHTLQGVGKTRRKCKKQISCKTCEII